jgi:hypothetical protein
VSRVDCLLFARTRMHARARNCWGILLNSTMQSRIFREHTVILVAEVDW